MSRLVKAFVVLAALVVAPMGLAAREDIPGTWTRLAPAPNAVLPGASVWTGRLLLVVGHKPFMRSTGVGALVAQAYDPVAKRWTKVAQPTPKLGTDPYCCSAVWTGKEALVMGAFAGAAYNPATNTWQSLPRSVQGGILVWTGREAIGWGGGCCGDARSNGRAYNPATRTFRTIARSPLSPSQSPVGAWTGHTLLLFVNGLNPDGRPYPSSFSRGAAYDPAANAWRRLPAMPANGGKALWDGHELLVVGAGKSGRATLAFDPATRRWRRLAPLPSNVAESAVWTGKRVFVWGSSRGFSYDLAANRWSALPKWPLRSRSGPLVAWTGRSLIVWGGEIGTPVGTSIPPKFPVDGASFTPSVRT
jgi:hypothetical protein